MAITAELLRLQRSVSTDNHPPGDDVTFVPSHTKVQPQHLSPSLVIVDDAMPSSSNDPKRKKCESGHPATQHLHSGWRLSHAHHRTQLFFFYYHVVLMLLLLVVKKEPEPMPFPARTWRPAAIVPTYQFIYFSFFHHLRSPFVPRIMPGERHDSFHFFFYPPLHPRNKIEKFSTLRGKFT